MARVLSSIELTRKSPSGLHSALLRMAHKSNIFIQKSKSPIVNPPNSQCGQSGPGPKYFSQISKCGVILSMNSVPNSSPTPNKYNANLEFYVKKMFKTTKVYQEELC